ILLPPTRRRERSGLGHLTMPCGPSEAEETAVSADGTEVAFFFPSVNCSGTRAFEIGRDCQLLCIPALRTCRAEGRPGAPLQSQSGSPLLPPPPSRRRLRR